MSAQSEDPALPVTLRGDGLVLREWVEADLARMTELFDEPSVDQWTPLESPFDLGAARRYLARTRQTRLSGRGLQLAITTDGGMALGEVLLFGRTMAPGDTDDAVAELGYMIGIAHRGQGLAARAVRVVIRHAVEVRGLRRFAMRIAPGNHDSQRVAMACGFRLTEAPLLLSEEKGRRVELATWESSVLPIIAPGAEGNQRNTLSEY